MLSLCPVPEWNISDQFCHGGDFTKIQTRTQTEETLRTLMHVYMVFTLLSCCLIFMPFPLPGSNAVFYLFLGVMLLPESSTLVSRLFAALLLTIAAYPIALLVGYILALVKKWYRAFGILMAISPLIAVAFLLPVLLEDPFDPPLVIIFDIIIDIFYAIYFFRLQKEFVQEQAEPTLIESAQPEQEP